jgi:hypothetical protein
MYVVILKSHNNTIHKVWATKEGFSKETIEEIVEMARLFMQEVCYMEVCDKDISAEEIMLDITKLNSPKEQEHRLD